jgi:hypothetical protein
MKVKCLFGVIAVALLIVVGTVAANEAWSGYNYDARVFVGTRSLQCQQARGWPEENCTSMLGIYANDQMLGTWTAEYDRGKYVDGWSNPPYDGAGYSIKYNGMFEGGSGTTRHVKGVWVGTNETTGYPIFKILTLHGTDEDGHYWSVHETPSGYGAF